MGPGDLSRGLGRGAAPGRALASALEIALYAMFVAIVVPQAKKSRAVCVAGAAGGGAGMPFPVPPWTEPYSFRLGADLQRGGGIRFLRVALSAGP